MQSYIRTFYRLRKREPLIATREALDLYIPGTPPRAGWWCWRRRRRLRKRWRNNDNGVFTRFVDFISLFQIVGDFLSQFTDSPLIHTHTQCIHRQPPGKGLWKVAHVVWVSSTFEHLPSKTSPQCGSQAVILEGLLFYIRTISGPGKKRRSWRTQLLRNRYKTNSGILSWKKTLQPEVWV